MKVTIFGGEKIQANDPSLEGGAQEIVRDVIPPYPDIGFDDLRHLLYHDDTTGGRCYIVCRSRPPKNGGSGLVVIRFSALGFGKVVSPYFPLTEVGWTGAWEALAAIDPKEFEKLRKRVVRDGAKYAHQRADRERRREAERNTLVILKDLTFLSGYTPRATLSPQHVYDLRFMADSLQICEAGTPRATVMLDYDSFLNIQTTGPGLIQSTSPFVDPVKKFIGSAINSPQLGINENIINAADGAISIGLNALGTSRNIRSFLSVQTTDSELSFLNTRTEPEQLRIDLSPAFGRIREILGSARADSESSPDASSIIAQLKDASTLLDRGLITRAEFEWLKSRVLPGD
jgi:hypothetical protein